jgi:hypothetical protein
MAIIAVAASKHELNEGAVGVAHLGVHGDNCRGCIKAPRLKTAGSPIRDPRSPIPE